MSDDTSYRGPNYLQPVWPVPVETGLPDLSRIAHPEGPFFMRLDPKDRDAQFAEVFKQLCVLQDDMRRASERQFSPVDVTARVMAGNALNTFNAQIWPLRYRIEQLERKLSKADRKARFNRKKPR